MTVRGSRRLAATLSGAAALVLSAPPLSAQGVELWPPAASAVSAVSADAPPLTVAGAMALAREHHPALVAASARRRAEVGLARREGALPNPVLEWRREGIGGSVEPDLFITASQPLDLTGRRLALRAAAREVDARAAAESVMVAREVGAGAARAFWGASLARSLLDVAVVQSEDAERLARVEGDRAREGAVAELVAMRAAVELERARLAEATARADWARAVAELSRAVGLAADALPPVPSLEPAPPHVPTLPAIGASVAAALERRSDLAALRAGVETARHRQSAERRGVLSDLSLQVGTMRSEGLDMRTLGVALPLPLLDRNAGGREHAAGALALAAAELDAAERATRAEVTAAVEGLAALLAARSPGADSLAARAAEVARVADEAYAAGGGTLLDLLDARRARAEALATALRWAAELRLALLELDRVSGLPLLESLEVP